MRLTITVQRYAGLVGVVLVRLFEPDPEDRPTRGPENSNHGWAGVPQRREPCDPQECEAVVGTCLWSGGRLTMHPILEDSDGSYLVRSTGRPFEEVAVRVTTAQVGQALAAAREAGLWRESEHSWRKRYSELDPSAPTSVTVEVDA